MLKDILIMVTMNHSKINLQRKSIRLVSVLFSILWVFLFVIFSALGVWQLQRLKWKTNLITSANQRIHLTPIKAPPYNQWPDITFNKDEYRPVTITGKLLTNKNIFVTAVTQNTTGYWVLTPLKTTDDTVTFVNRGFIPMEARHQFEQEEKNAPLDNNQAHTLDQITITGLLRMSEKNGFFPRKNKPDQNLWHTRELPAMAKKLNVSPVAPYFIDAQSQTVSQENLPIPGLTVVQFHNNHLTYAITWFILAAGVLGTSLLLLRYKN
ncbi:SURF1 family protein [Bartonella sp. G70]|uniref:SURF1-like protein n=1 Tax=Bartonella bilalgolemii TaxID=2942911 RepID=A0ABT0P6N3_9HYPH|nr:SURF1 family protein [Bartonella sp. G70]MCL6229129.1 SURF1 family protein [Bartonella sp. G70]